MVIALVRPTDGFKYALELTIRKNYHLTNVNFYEKRINLPELP
jgi:hypothetical protein